jgi:malate dehydrogenase (oxaloacetate-decarboxylating)(NADP+)
MTIGASLVDTRNQGTDVTSQPFPDLYSGVKILHDPVRNKGTAYTDAERDALKLRGLLPPRVHSMAEQELRVLGNIRAKPTDLERYLYLIALQDRNENLFYRVIMNHIEEMMPIIYTPTVGKACQEFQHIYRTPRGFYVSLQDKGHIKEILQNWPHKGARIIVVTDGERILGLGDLGADGMGIPIGKLSLYTACAGIHPTQCLPVMLDVGTNNEKLLNDPLYNGLERRRASGKDYDELFDEFVTAAKEVFPGILIQIEDFGNTNAFRLLKKYRSDTCLFDDDIQGTGAVAVAGIIAATRITGSTLSEQKLLFLGAGEAGIGTADVFVAALKEEGMSTEDARKHCWFFDSKGLLVAGRDNIAVHKKPYAQEHEHIAEFLDAVNALQPTAILGLSGQPGKFTKDVLEAMAKINARPIIFALSNPTSKAEQSDLRTRTGQQRLYLPRRRIGCDRQPFPRCHRRDVPGRCAFVGQPGHRIRPRERPGLPGAVTHPPSLGVDCARRRQNGVRQRLHGPGGARRYFGRYSRAHVPARVPALRVGRPHHQNRDILI